MFVVYVTLFVCMCVYYRKWIRIFWRMYWITKQAPVAPGALPVVGHLRKLLIKNSNDAVWEFFSDITKYSIDAGGVCIMWTGPHNIYVVTDPDDALTIANTCVRRDHMYLFARSWVGRGLLTADKKTWKIHRKLINPAFNQHVLDNFLVTFNYQSRHFMKRLDELVGKGYFDHWPLLSHYGLQAICETAFGLPPNHESINADSYGVLLEKTLTIFIERALSFWKHFDFFYKFTEMKKQEEEVCKKMKSVSYTVLKARQAKVDGNNNANGQLLSNGKKSEFEGGRRYKAFLDLLLELYDAGSLTEKEVREEVDTMIVAGFDTTSSTLLIVMSILGCYPEIQEKLHDELLEVFGESDRDVTKEDLPKLVYMEAVIKEIMRLHPTVPMIGRRIDRDLQINNLTLAKGTTAFISLMGVLRNKKFWGEDADVFCPERWLDPSRIPKSAGAQAAFSIGRRNCIGKSYAYMSMKTLLAHTLRQFTLKKEENTFVMGFQVLAKPKSGHKISVSYR